MKIRASQDGGIELEEVYCGIGIVTDQGYFGIAQRDSGIEVMLDGELVWSSTAGPMQVNRSLQDRVAKLEVAVTCINRRAEEAAGQAPDGR